MTTESLLCGAFELSFQESSIAEMTYEDFVQSATENEKEFAHLPTEEIEDLFWEKVKCPNFETLYSMETDASLFSDNVNLWNLNKLTKKQSIIHGSKVSSFNFLLIFLKLLRIAANS